MLKPSNSNRMQTKEQYRDLGSESETVTFVPVVDPSIPFGVKDIEVLVPPRRVFYSRVTTNPEGGRLVWKSFEHFKSVQADPASGQGGSLLRAESSDYYPNHSEGVAKNPFVGYHRYWWGSQLSPYGDPGSLDASLPAFIVERADGGFIPPPSDLENLIALSMRYMLPVIRAELSLPNSLYELKDFKRPLHNIIATVQGPTFKRFVQELSTGRMPGAIKRLLRRRSRGRPVSNWSFGDVARVAASGFLQWKFNLAPLLSDISAVCTALSSAEKRINAFLAQAGRPQNKHFVYRWTEFPDPPYSESTGGYWDWHSQYQTMQTLWAGRTVNYEPTVFHAQLQYNYNYTAFQVANARLFAILDSLGVQMNPSIVWNAIPWTFVIDWVVGVSRFLDSMKTMNMEPQINIRRFLWSVRRQRRIYVSKGIVATRGSYPTQKSPLPVVTQTAYRRTVTLPSASSLMASGLSLDEITIGAALVISRKRRRR